MSSPKYKLVIFCPTTHTKGILKHIFDSFPQTAGRISNYSSCAFISAGTGQFIPEKGSNPVIGQVGAMEQVEENRVEFVVLGGQENLKAVVQELKKAHPYEEVPYDVYRLRAFNSCIITR